MGEGVLWQVSVAAVGGIYRSFRWGMLCGGLAIEGRGASKKPHANAWNRQRGHGQEEHNMIDKPHGALKSHKRGTWTGHGGNTYHDRPAW